MLTPARLRERREHVGLTQGQVAQYEGITPQYLYKLEQGINSPPAWPLLARLARRYKCTVDYLLELTDNPNGYAPAPELPSFGREVLEVMARLSEGRREELHQHALVLEDAERRERNERQAAVYLDQAEAMGADVLDALLTALGLARADGLPAAEAFIRAFWAEKAQQIEKDLHQV
jgi:transcriptional regulator with XRE-family HTH domain